LGGGEEKGGKQKKKKRKKENFLYFSKKNFDSEISFKKFGNETHILWKSLKITNSELGMIL
jgi:hypothetical protein